MRTAPKHRSNRRRIVRALIAGMVGAALLTAPAVAMAATAPSPETSVTTIGSVPMVDDYGGITAFPKPDTQDGSSKLVPLNRWSDSTTSLHTRPAGDIGGVINKVATDAITGTSLAWNSGLWTATNAMSNFAANLEPIRAIGAQIDFATENLGKMVLANPLLFILVSLGLIIAAIWVKSRGQSGVGLLKRSLSVVLVVAAIAVMSMGASNSKGGENGVPYQPGVGSPGWVLLKVSDTVGAVTNGLVNTITTAGFSTSDEMQSTGEQMTCDRYLQNLHGFFQNSKRTDGSANQADAVSGLWMNTGRMAWSDAQFGSDNKIAERVWCHYADMQANVRPDQQIWLTSLGLPNGEELRKTANPRSLAFSTSNEFDLDRSMIGWAACKWGRGGWSVYPEFQTKKDGSAWISANMCEAWWTGDQKTNIDNGGSSDGADFNISTGGGTDQNIEDYTDNADVLNFVKSWQGTNAGFGPTISAGWALVAGFICFLLFGLILSGAIIWAKFMGVLLMSLLVVTLLASMFSREGVGKRSTELAKQLVGFTVVAAGASAIMVLVSWLTHTLVVAGKSLIGGDIIWALIWTALAPLIAILVLHHTFKKMFNKPSPFTLKGLSSWGTAGAAAAGGVLAGGAMERWKNRGQSAVEGKGREIGSRALNRMSGGRLGTPGSGGPVGGPGKAVGAGAPPKAVGAAGTRQLQAAAKDEQKAVEEHWKAQGNKVPMTAAQRAGRAVAEAGRATAAGATTVGMTMLLHKESAKKIGAGAKGVATGVAAGAQAIGQKTAAGYRKAAGEARFAGDMLRQVATDPEARKFIRQAAPEATKQAAKTAWDTSWNGYQKVLDKSRQKIGEIPGGAPRVLGLTALGAAGVAATALTGGAAGLVLAPIAIGSKIRHGHRERATAQQEMHASYAQEQQRVKAEESKRLQEEEAIAARAARAEAKQARKASDRQQASVAQAAGQHAQAPAGRGRAATPAPQRSIPSGTSTQAPPKPKA
ncbi:hypothetical protein ACFVAJ_16490 [Agromyces sp. NPDC057679]|uniref:hypothetical protein n=1 Tax=Agromyces sp. NPDC057679 TaxID=3346207 RepID=UPI0036718C3B